MSDKPETTDFCKKYLGITPNPILQKIFEKADRGEGLVISQPPVRLGKLIRDAEERMNQWIRENL